jgi:hypothetical protein
MRMKPCKNRNKCNEPGCYHAEEHNSNPACYFESSLCPACEPAEQKKTTYSSELRRHIRECFRFYDLEVPEKSIENKFIKRVQRLNKKYGK